MQKPFLDHLLANLVGKQVLPLIALLYGKSKVNEFHIAKKLKLTINQTRNLLYKLSDLGVVSSTRKKDKRKGWFTYFWTWEMSKSYLLSEQLLQKNIAELDMFIKTRQQQRFYVCLTCHLEMQEEDALLRQFSCPECGNVLSLKDDSKSITELQKQRAKLASDLVLVQNYLAQEREALERKMERTTQKRIKKGKKKEKKQKSSLKKKITVVKKSPVKKNSAKIKAKSKKSFSSKKKSPSQKKRR